MATEETAAPPAPEEPWEKERDSATSSDDEGGASSSRGEEFAIGAQVKVSRPYSRRYDHLGRLGRVTTKKKDQEQEVRFSGGDSLRFRTGELTACPSPTAEERATSDAADTKALGNNTRVTVTKGPRAVWHG